MGKFILASASPRRREILERAGYKFEVITSQKEEKTGGLSPKDLAVKNALIKAEDVFSRVNGETALVLGADTVVALGDKIFGKPKDKEDAKNILKALSGKTHEVITGYALISGKGKSSGYALTKVVFNDLSDDLIERYVEEGSCLDKAGAYGIQDGFNLVKEYIGDYDNVVGLPIKAIAKTIEEFLK